MMESPACQEVTAIHEKAGHVPLRMGIGTTRCLRDDGMPAAPLTLARVYP